ncbi:MAG TPA: amidase [Erwinia sp.]|uniref:amidase n=1 Tax=Erwinia citreus TaxID=558 RepID=UPI000E7FAE0B|nr:amidase [Erwinia sp.]HBV40370.1 amidase [Erwinia sp.]
MNLSDYTSCDAVGLAMLIAQGDVTPEEVNQAAIKAIEKVNGEIHAVIEIWQDEPANLQGPLQGVPMLVKDLGIAVSGRRNELGSRLTAGYVSAQDSTLTQKMRQAGLVLLGRTTTPELAASTTTEPRFNGGTVNPWNKRYSAGGSSGGSAAAVASGMVPAAHATDGGGSIRVPASANGLFGLKPSRGRISMGPEVDEVWSGLAVHGFVSRTVRDSAALLDAVQGNTAGDPFIIAATHNTLRESAVQAPRPLRIGVITHPLNGRRSDPEVVAALEQTVGQLIALGHQPEEATLDIGRWEAFVEMNTRFWAANTAAWIDALAGAMNRSVNADTLEPSNLALWQLGHELSAVEMVGAMHMRNAVTQRMGQFYQQYDMLLTPVLPALPTELGHYNRHQDTLDGRGWMHHVFDQSPFTALANVCGTPAMSVPLGLSPSSHLPIGMQFLAGFNQEPLLLQLAGQLERAFPWHRRKPAVWAGQ